MESFKCYKGIITRSLICFILFGFILMNTIFQFGVTDEQPSGITDKLHNNLKFLNDFFKENENLKNILFVINNLILDLSGIFLMIIWLSLVKNFKIIFSFTLFFAIKIVTELIFLVKPPNNNLISYPGVPSIFYSYNKNNFFFFSGIAGFYFIMINEFLENRNKIKLSFIFAWVNIFNLLFFIFISLCTYSVYTIDILMGITTALYSIRISRFIYEYNLKENNENEKDFFEDLFNFLKIADSTLPITIEQENPKNIKNDETNQEGDNSLGENNIYTD